MNLITLPPTLTCLFLCAVFQSGGDGARETGRVRVPPVVRDVSGALQDALAAHVAGLVRPGRRGRHLPAPGPAHLHGRVCLRSDQAVHPQPGDGETPQPGR